MDLPGLAEVIIGAIILAIGAIALGFATLQRPRADRTVVWFGVFVVLYGIRMVVRVQGVQATVPLPPGVWAAVDSTVTHVIGVPAALFIESLLGARRDRLIRLAVYVFATRAVIGIVTDVIRQGPGVDGSTDSRPAASPWPSCPTPSTPLAAPSWRPVTSSCCSATG